MSQSPFFSKTFVLMQQEGYLMKSALTGGLNSLVNAHVGDKGACYVAFFNLSIGLERLCKCILIIDFMAQTNLQLPDQKAMKAYGHKLKDLFAAIEKSASRVASGRTEALIATPFDSEVISLLNDFAIGDRYFNLDTLKAHQSSNDPLARWHSILEGVAQASAPMHKISAIHSGAAYVAGKLQGNSAIFMNDLRGHALDLHGYFSQPAIQLLAIPFVTERLVRIVRLLKEQIRFGCEAVNQLEVKAGRNTPLVPWMDEFLQFSLVSGAAVRRKRRWQ